MSKLLKRWKHWISLPWIRWCVIPLVLMVLVILGELFAFHSDQLALPAEQRKEIGVAVEEVRKEDLTDQERGYSMTEEEKQAARELEPSEHFYRIRVDQEYTNKLAIRFRGEQGNSFYTSYSVKYRKKGTDEKTELREIQTVGMLDLGGDYTYIGDSVDLILIETDSRVEVEQAIIDNSFHWNVHRMLCLYAIAITAYLLIVCRKAIGRKMEIGFLIVGLAVGLVWVVSLQPATVNLSWDDGIHFDNANSLSYGENVIEYSEIEYLESTFITHKCFDTVEDQNAYVNWVNEQAENYSFERIVYRNWELSDAGYTTQSIGLWLGRTLGLPFSTQFMLGQLGNMLLYVGVCYLAIKVAVRFKAVICTIALFPTAMTMACTYSYDPTVISFSLLACSLFIREMSTPKTLMNWKHAALMLAAFCIASFPKAVYIPMILLLLFLPKTKFVDKKAHIGFKIGVIVLFVVMMSSFVVPVLFVKGGGDMRGGNDVNTEAQLKFILSNPVAYAKVLIKSIADVFDIFPINEARMSLPYLADGETLETPTYLYGIINAVSIGLMFYVLFTDKHRKPGTEELKEGIRWWMIITIGGILVLIWTALYLAFTPVATGTIAGVQGRYYIPLFLLVAAVLSPRYIRNDTDPVRYNTMILGMNAFVLFGCVWMYLITSFWL